MIVVLAGASGLIGSALVESLAREGHTCRLLVRREPRPTRGVVSEFSWDPHGGQCPPEALSGADAAVNLAGSPVAARWTSAGRSRIALSRITASRTLARAIADVGDGPRVLVQGSATGYYGDRGEAELEESAAPGSGFLADVVRRWEAAAAPAAAAGARVAFARSGIVLAPKGGALGRLLPLVRLGLGGPLGNGRQWWSWITLRDEVRALTHLLRADVEGPVNLTAPAPARQRDVSRALARALHRPCVLRTPGWALRLAIGGFASEILASQRVLPAGLLASGFEYRDTTIGAAAQWVATPIR